MISEVARALKCTETHIRDLIDEGQLMAVDIAGADTPRKCLRIPVSAYDAFIGARKV